MDLLSNEKKNRNNNKDKEFKQWFYAYDIIEIY